MDEEKTLKDKFQQLFEEYKKQIQEEVLFNILRRFYFADWTRACDYNNMTSEDVVEAAMSICHEIEKDYNYTIDNDLIQMPF